MWTPMTVPGGYLIGSCRIRSTNKDTAAGCFSSIFLILFLFLFTLVLVAAVVIDARAHGRGRGSRPFYAPATRPHGLPSQPPRSEPVQH